MRVRRVEGDPLRKIVIECPQPFVEAAGDQMFVCTGGKCRHRRTVPGPVTRRSRTGDGLRRKSRVEFAELGGRIGVRDNKGSRRTCTHVLCLCLGGADRQHQARPLAFDLSGRGHQDYRVSTDDLRTRARELRAAGKTPQQIARTLGVPRARVTDLVRGVRPDRPVVKESPLIGCWVSRQWSNGLLIDDRPADWIDDHNLRPFTVGAGLCSVAVAREHGDTDASVCGYLVDTFCLGIKNAIPATTVSRRELADFVEDFYRAYPSPPLPARSSWRVISCSAPSSTPAASGSTRIPTSTSPPHTSVHGSHRAGSRSEWKAGRCTSTARTTTRPASCASSTGQSARATTT
jgi:hypothetical protein